MSIEQSFERIAVALEKLVALSEMAVKPGKQFVVQGEFIPPPAEVPAAKTTKATKAKKEPEPVVEAEVKTLPEDVPTAKAELTATLRAHAARFGTPATKNLMIKAGAAVKAPTVDSIPAENWQSLYETINKELTQ